MTEAAVGSFPFVRCRHGSPTQFSPGPASLLPRALDGCPWPGLGGLCVLGDLTTLVPTVPYCLYLVLWDTAVSSLLNVFCALQFPRLSSHCSSCHLVQSHIFFWMPLKYQMPHATSSKEPSMTAIPQAPYILLSPSLSSGKQNSAVDKLCV